MGFVALVVVITRPGRLVPMEGVEPTHSYEYQILSLARLPIPPHRPVADTSRICIVPDHTGLFPIWARNLKGSRELTTDYTEYTDKKICLGSFRLFVVRVLLQRRSLSFFEKVNHRLRRIHR